jgi:hypothetical protein
MVKTLRMIFVTMAAALAVAQVPAFSQTDKPKQSPKPAAGPAFYVSPTGDDKNPGTKDRPVRSLNHARELVRRLNRKMTDDITVYLAGGVYRLSEPLALDASDSGTNSHNIIYTAGDERPVISGAVQVTGWKQTDAARNLWSAPAPAALKNTRQLYVNGVRAQRARGPLPVSVTQTSTGYTASSAVMARWRNASDIEFVYTGGNALWSEGSYGLGPWTEPRCPVASIEGTAITMAQPCWDNSTKRVMLPSGKRTANLVGPASVGKQPAYIENAYELLGTPGQWYFDRSAGVLYYVPRPGEDLTKADVEVPVLEKLISGQGTKDAPIHNIVFSHLQFSYATWLTPNTGEGFSEIQANVTITGKEGYATQGLCKLVPNGTCPYGAWTKIPGNVSFLYDNSIQFLNDAFVHLGAAGLDLGNGSQSDLVQGCVFTDISGNGLELGDIDLPLAKGGEITSDNQILNNHLYEIAAEYHGGVAIDVGYAQRTTIKHQQIDHVPYTAVSFGWGGWPDKIQQAGQANFSQKNAFGHSLIFDHMLLLADGGAIYTQGLTGPKLSEGEKIYATVIHDQLGSGHGIYTDNGSCNITIDHNVILNTNFDNWGGRHGDYYDGKDGKTYDPLDIESNYWQQGTQDTSEKNVTVKGNHIVNAVSQAPASIVEKAGLQPEYRDLLKLSFAAPAAPEPPSRIAVFGGDGFAYVAWNPPILEGGAPVESYTVTSSKGDKATISSTEFWSKGFVKLAGLANGNEYTFTVTATNANGSSSPSLPSHPVTPSAKAIRPPAAPANVQALVGDGAASVHFGAPEDNGGSPITAYTITARPTSGAGDRKVTLTGRSVLTLGGRHTMFGVVDGLEPGQTYTFDVTGTNAAGEGPKSSR